jgi:anti-anti-sigma factor
MNKPTVISISVVGELAYLTIRGRMVAGKEVAAVRETILRAGPNLGLLVVNLREVTTIDASGLSALLFVYSTAQSLGARFRLAAVPPKIRQLLCLTGLNSVFSMPETEWPEWKTQGLASSGRRDEVGGSGREYRLFDQGEQR